MDHLATPLKQVGWTQAELARRSGVSVTLICDVRKGRKRKFSAQVAADLVAALAAELGTERVNGLFEKLAGIRPRGEARHAR